MEQNLLAQLAVIEEQLRALNLRLENPVAHKAQAYVPIPNVSVQGAGLSFRDMERKDPAALARMQQEEPHRFAALYQAAYGQNGGVA
jgi:hypothetical protein